MRAITSVGPPAANGTIILTEWLGYACAVAFPAGTSAALASASSTTNPRNSVVTAPSFVLLCAHHRARAGRSKWGSLGPRPQAAARAHPPEGSTMPNAGSNTAPNAGSKKKLTRQDLREAAEKYKNWG